VWRRRLETQPPGGATLVAQAAGAIVGFASCGAARHRLEGLEAEVYALYVLQEHQRRGIGAALLAGCAHHFVRQGLFGFYLWALKANRARLFYEALGGMAAGEKSERLGQHSFLEVAYAWHDLTALAGRGGPAEPLR
jgi:ribosomal protein S18 acetylase RimI-like enzyme